MDNIDTINCFNDVKESILNTQLIEELALLTPRDINDIVDSWATEDTDKEKVKELVFDWLDSEGHKIKNDHVETDVKYRRIKLTISNAKEALDFMFIGLKITDMDMSQFKKAEEKDAITEEKYEKNLLDWKKYWIAQGIYDDYCSSDPLIRDEAIEELNEKRGQHVKEYLNKIPYRRKELVKQTSQHGKCNIDIFKTNMYHFLDYMERRLDKNNQSRLVSLLHKMRYGQSDDLNGYPYLLLFLLELIQYEFILCREIYPYKEEIISFKRYKHEPEEEIWTKRLNYYKNIGERNKYRHSATLSSDKWDVPFENFAKLYRKLLGFTKKSIISPIK